MHQKSLDFAFFYCNMWMIFPTKWNTKDLILVRNKIIWTPLPFFQLVRALFSSEMKDEDQSNQENHEWWRTLGLGQKMKPPAARPSIARITSGGSEKPVLSWLTGCVVSRGVTFLEAHTQNTRQRKSYHYPPEPVVWKDERLASGSCKEWWGVR